MKSRFCPYSCLLHYLSRVLVLFILNVKWLQSLEGFGSVRNITGTLQQDLILNCDEYKNVGWIHFDKRVVVSSSSSSSEFTLSNGSLRLSQLSSSDEGFYECFDLESNTSLITFFLHVLSLPDFVYNFRSVAFESYVTLSWDHGNKSVESYFLGYRLASSSSSTSWTNLSELSGTSTSFSLYGLKPNSSYIFRIFAVNRVGRSRAVCIEATTKANDDDLNSSITGTDSESSPYVLWSLGVSFLIVPLFLLILGMICHVIRNRSRNPMIYESSDEAMELVPHITLNPSFNIDMLEHIGPEDSSSS